MRHPIDPKIDCVFKAMLGAELPAPVAQVVILSPYIEREFPDDKLSVVEVKARDGQGRLFQIEIQLLVLPELPARNLYGRTDLYRAQLASGEDYTEPKPAYSLWLLGETLFPEVPGYAHRYRLRDEADRSPGDHGGIALFELGKLAAAAPHPVESEGERWLRFFVEGEPLDPAQLPEWMETPEMGQAMSTLSEFSEKERQYHAYQARQNYLRQQRSIARRIESFTAEAARERE